MGGSLTKNVSDLVSEIFNSAITKVYTDNSNNIRVFNNNILESDIKLENVKCKVIDIRVTILSDTKIITQFTTENIADIKNNIQNEINNRSEQISQAVIGFLGGLGKNDSVENVTNITNRAVTIIFNSITSQNLNQIILSVSNIVSSKVEIKNIEGELCTFIASIQSIQLIDNVVKNVQKSLVTDEILNRIVTDIKQTATLEQKGIDSVFTSLIIIIAIIAVVIIVGLIVIAATGAKALTNPKFWITIVVVLAIIVGAWLGLAYGFKFYPFKETQTQFWGCAKEISDTTGALVNKGKCQLVTNAVEGPYTTKAACEADAAKGVGLCPQYWGCARGASGVFSGGCAQYDSPLYGTYSTKNSCQIAAGSTPICQTVFACDQTPDGKLLPYCRAYNKGDIKDGMKEEDCKREAVGNSGMCLTRYMCLPISSGNKTKKCQVVRPGVSPIGDLPGIVFVGDTGLIECDKTCNKT